MVSVMMPPNAAKSRQADDAMEGNAILRNADDAAYEKQLCVMAGTIAQRTCPVDVAENARSQTESLGSRLHILKGKRSPPCFQRWEEVARCTNSSFQLSVKPT
jgi:hypothetical protein